MAEYLTQYTNRQLRCKVLSVYLAFKSPDMHRKFLLLVLCMGICLAFLVTHLPELANLTFANHLLTDCHCGTSVAVTSVSYTETRSGSRHRTDTSPSLRTRHKLPISSDVKKATAALNIALELQEKGQTDKAFKVFQDALKLDPHHADILAAYGEFLELHMNDVLQADHYYKIAMKVSPMHTKALENQQRTGPVVEEMDQKHLNRIDQKRALLYTVPANHPTLLHIKREAYFAHIYNSNAIEGNTLTLSETRAIVETRTAIERKSLMEQNEVLGLDAALSYVNSTLVGRVGSLNLKDVLSLHRLVLGYVDPTQAGRFRDTQVIVGEFIPAPPVDVPSLMDGLALWLNSKEALGMHPIEFAAVAHYELVFIHPFYDGNGRTSRLLMNVILMQAGYPLVSVLVKDRLRYYETLEMANHGDVRPFIRFIADSAERTLDGYLAATVENLEHSLQQTSDHQNSTAQKR